jgi:hypothetical protein
MPILKYSILAPMGFLEGANEVTERSIISSFIDELPSMMVHVGASAAQVWGNQIHEAPLSVARMSFSISLPYLIRSSIYSINKGVSSYTPMKHKNAFEFIYDRFGDVALDVTLSVMGSIATSIAIGTSPGSIMMFTSSAMAFGNSLLRYWTVDNYANSKDSIISDYIMPGVASAASVYSAYQSTNLFGLNKALHIIASGISSFTLVGMVGDAISPITSYIEQEMKIEEMMSNSKEYAANKLCQIIDPVFDNKILMHLGDNYQLSLNTLVEICSKTEDAV